MGRVQLRSVLFSLFLLISLPLLSADIPLNENGLPHWEEAVFVDFPVRIRLQDSGELRELLERVEIPGFHREQVRLIADTPFSSQIHFEPRITETVAHNLREAGIPFERIEDAEQLERRQMEEVWAKQASLGGDTFLRGDRGVYHTHAQAGAILQQAEADHPAIADFFNIGNSVQGRELWMIRISDNVMSEENEPEIRLSSTMHGNEPPGMEMLLYLVDYLTDNYGSDPDVTYLVDNYELHIMPLHNPDGHAVGSRYNANGVDLNRNFPVPDGSIGEDGTYSEEIETILFKNYAFDHHFVISENGHSGALVVNYPWDHTYTLTPDNDAIILLSEEYSYYNSPMWNGDWWHGITNGADWYVVHGSLQDWSYEETGCIDVTIEYSDSFSPPASQLETYWNNNRESFMHWIKAARYGVNGTVTASDTGLPLEATVTVAGNAKSVSTDPDFGDYYKLLDNGSWDISYSAPGYITHTEYGVSTNWGTPTVINVQLNPVANGDVWGYVIGAGNPLDATIEVRSWPSDTYVTTTFSSASSGGLYSVNLVYGEYKLIASEEGFMDAESIINLNSDDLQQNFSLYASEELLLFDDDFESGDGQWTGGWSLTSSTSSSPTHSMTDSPSGDYGNNESNPTAMIAGVNLTGVMEPVLSFQARWEIETNWDCVQLQASTNGGSSWTALATQFTEPGSGQGSQPSGEPVFEGTQNSWVENTVDLSAYEEESDLRFRFLLSSDSSVRKDGFYFDDFSIVGTVVSTDAENPVYQTALLGAWPNPFNPKTSLRFELESRSVCRISLHDVRGREIALLQEGPLEAGSHDLTWDGRDREGCRLPSGVYFARMQSGGKLFTQKLTLLK